MLTKHDRRQTACSGYVFGNSPWSSVGRSVFLNRVSEVRFLPGAPRKSPGQWPFSGLQQAVSLVRLVRLLYRLRIATSSESSGGRFETMCRTSRRHTRTWLKHIKNRSRAAHRDPARNSARSSILEARTHDVIRIAIISTACHRSRTSTRSASVNLTTATSSIRDHNSHRRFAFTS